MSKENKLKYSMRNVEDLIPYARNARTHSPEQVAKIAGSIKEFGFLNPVIISSDGGILAGHGRVLAAKKLGLEEVPCVEETHLTETQRRAYILADNKLALDADWDDDMLRLEIEELRGVNFDLEISGFGFDEIENLLNKRNEHTSNKTCGEREELEFKTEKELVVVCDSEEEQKNLYNELTERGYQCRVQGL